MIYTEEEIELAVSHLVGTHIRRNAARRRMQKESNDEVTAMINGLQVGIRAMKAAGAKQRDLSPLFNEVSKLQMRFL